MGQLEGRRPLKGPQHIRKNNIKMVLQEVGWEPWSGFIWLRIGRGGGLL
jgi:hypothetical protein